MSQVATIHSGEIEPPTSQTVSETGSVLLMIERIIRDPKIDMDRVERAFAMHREMRAEEAKRMFNVAMAAIQSELPHVKRDALNDHTRSRYARLETIAAAVDPIITKHGVSLSFGTEASPTQGHIRIICDVALGSHEKRYFLDLPADGVGAKGNSTKTATHAAGSTFSYGRRYLKLMIFDIALTNEDNDGNRVGGEDDRPAPRQEPRQEQRREAQKAEVVRHERPVITDAQALDLRDLMRERRVVEADFLFWLKLARIEDIPADIHAECVTAVRNFGRN